MSPDGRSQGSHEYGYGRDSGGETIDDGGLYSSRFSLVLDRIAYLVFGGLFRNNEEQYERLDRALNQARIPVSYDIYLSRALFSSLTVAIAGLALALVVTLTLGDVLVQYETGLRFPPDVAAFILENQLALIIGGTGLLSMGVLFVSSLAGFYYYPFYVSGERKREINTMLPHAVTFMYAMSRGGVNVIDVIRSLAQADDSYGAVAEEMRAVINNVDYAREDLRSAIMIEAQETPSDSMQDLFEDMLNVIDTGSDMSEFFFNKSEKYMKAERKEQENLLEVLELLSEMYVTVFVASPIFVLVILVVISIVGTANIAMLYLLTYFALPMGGVLFSAVIMLISSTGTEGYTTLDRSDAANPWSGVTVDESRLSGDTRYNQYRRQRRKSQLISQVTSIGSVLRNNPFYSMGFTLPMAGGWLYYVLTNDLATPTYEAVLNAPVWQTLVLVYIPALLIFGVLSVLHELKSRRESKILARLPEAFKSASDANERGLSVEESFKIVAENTGGELADELEQSVNETTWTGNLNDALIQFANSIGVPRLSRTVKLITKANEVSGDVQSVLKVAARDVEAMYDLEKDRKQNAASYIAIIIVSFLVSMFVIVVLDVAFLSTFESNSALSSGAANATESSSSGPSTGGFAGGGSGLPVKKFRMAFLHTTMTLGGASGIVAGSMASKDPVSGIKYSLVTMGLALAVFGLF